MTGLVGLLPGVTTFVAQKASFLVISGLGHLSGIFSYCPCFCKVSLSATRKPNFDHQNLIIPKIMCPKSWLA